MTGLNATRPLVLVAARDPALAAPYAARLESLGFQSLATAGPGVVDAAARGGVDLCVLAPGWTPAGGRDSDADEGLALCRLLKEDPRTARLPVLFLTQAAEPAVHARAVDAGADDVLGGRDADSLLATRVSTLLRLKSATDALDQSARRLRELEKIRDDLMQMIVHDLKTPLTSVLATLEILADGDLGGLTNQQERAVEDMRSMGDQLLELIDDLLEVWRIETTSLPLEPEVINPEAMLADLMREWTYRFRQVGAKASVDAAADTPSFRGDRAVLRRVFANLFQNALVHCTAPVRLRTSVAPDPGGVLFTVSDNGPGIPRAFHEVIFRTFHRLPKPNEPPVRGSGLGLAFCRLAVEAHGGRIWVDSEEGKGSAFRVLLPLEPRGPEPR